MEKHIHPMLASLTEKSHWFKRRDEALEAARKNMACLMTPWYSHCFDIPTRDGGTKHFEGTMIRPAYDRNDPIVINANRSWVQRARRAHNIAMGREPLFHSTVTTNAGTVSGLVFAK